MAQYKVPQNVEAEDKLLGPFTFRQFIYLIVGAALIAVAWGLFQIAVPLVILPIPFAIFFIVLALPLKKDQPMETYLAAVFSFYMRPNLRLWKPGQRDMTIFVTAPKVDSVPLTRNISEDEASHRLSFLSDLVDSEGYSIKGNSGSSMKDEYLAEANQLEDILDDDNYALNKMMENEQNARHAQLVNQMKTALSRTESLSAAEPQIDPSIVVQPDVKPAAPAAPVAASQPVAAQTFVPAPQQTPQPVAQSAFQYQPRPIAAPTVTPYKQQPVQVQKQLERLATNQNFSVETIAQQANRVLDTQGQAARAQAAAFNQFQQNQQNQYQAFQPQPMTNQPTMRQSIVSQPAQMTPQQIAQPQMMQQQQAFQPPFPLNQPTEPFTPAGYADPISSPPVNNSMMVNPNQGLEMPHFTKDPDNPAVKKTSLGYNPYGADAMQKFQNELNRKAAAEAERNKARPLPPDLNQFANNTPEKKVDIPGLDDKPTISFHD